MTFKSDKKDWGMDSICENCGETYGTHYGSQCPDDYRTKRKIEKLKLEEKELAKGLKFPDHAVWPFPGRSSISVKDEGHPWRVFSDTHFTTDPHANEKEAHKNGEKIEFYSGNWGAWFPAGDKPYWTPDTKYRIKTKKIIKVKFTNILHDGFPAGSFESQYDANIQKGEFNMSGNFIVGTIKTIIVDGNLKGVELV